MSEFGVKLPDVGEGVAEAELIAWHVAVGEQVNTSSVLAEVMTDKATVEILSPVAGVVTQLLGEPGDTLAVGGALVMVELDGSLVDAAMPEVAAGPVVATIEPTAPAAPAERPIAPEGQPGEAHRPTAAPAVRSRAHDLGIDLAAVAGSGPDGRVLHADLDRVLLGRKSGTAATATTATTATDEPRVETIRGVRRRIAERLTESSQIPTITYVDAVDATELEALRFELNRRGHSSGQRLTLLPFLVKAMVVACGEQPRVNSRYDHTTQSLSVFHAVHVGIATQTNEGLIVPVVHHAEARRLWDIALEITRVSAAARAGKATQQELTGSTITITSLGALGGLVTTPLLNQPEVAIVGVNKIETRPVWRDGAFVPRQMFNLSSSFDHRIIDGYDAATFVQRVRSLLETPAELFIDEQS
ncbi:MAG: dihydrolipoamide acetyltransferase family protein [Actinomycetota bacterium]